MRKEERDMNRQSDAPNRMAGRIMCLGVWIYLISLVWSCFADEPQETVVVLTEEEAIEIAIKNNYDILSKEEEIKEAQARLAQAWSAVFPYISANVNYTRYEDHPYLTYEDNRGYSFSVDQLLFAGGEILHTIDSANKALEAARMNKKELENKIIYNTKEAFYKVLLAKEVVRIRKETLELAEENLAVTKERYRKGEASHYDLLRSEVEVANIKPQLIKAENFLKVSYNFLRILLGLGFTQEIEVKGKFAYMPEDIDLNREIAFALEKRPVLKEIDLQEEAAQARVKVAFSGYLPQVRFKFTDYVNQKEAFSMGRENYDDYSVAGIIVSMPLFDGFLTRSKIKEAKAEARKVGILKKKLIDNVKIEVENAVLALKAAERIVESQKKM